MQSKRRNLRDATKRMGRVVVRGAMAALVLAGVAVALVLIYGPAGVDRVLNTTAPAPPLPPSGEALALHRSLLIADLHADTLLWNRDLLRRWDRGHVDLPRLIEGHVGIQAFTVVTVVPKIPNLPMVRGVETDAVAVLAVAQRWPVRTWASPLERALYQAAKLHDAAARSQGRLTVLRTRRDLEAFLEDRASDPRRVAGWLGAEGAYPLEGRLENLDRLHAAGFRMMGLVHLSDSEAGTSSESDGDSGLTEFGRDLIGRMEALGMVVDLSHASPRTLREALAVATRPVLASHGGVRGTCDNGRNLADDEVRAIAATGGLIGIGYWPTAVCGPRADAIARAVRYASDLVGVEHVALGSDFDGTVETPFDTAGLAWLTEALLDRGFEEAEIRAVMGGNVARFLLDVLPQS